MGRSAVAIELTAGERGELEGLAGRRRTAQGLARRARIVLLAAEGSQNKAIAVELGADRRQVAQPLRPRSPPGPARRAAAGGAPQDR